MIVDCGACGRPSPVLLAQPRCACGGVFRIPRLDPFDPFNDRDPNEPGVWRYQAGLPLPRPARHVSCLDEHVARLESVRIPELAEPILVCREDLQPSGSWHDRGASLMVRLLDPKAVQHVVVEDSIDAALSMLHYSAFTGWSITFTRPQTCSRAVVGLLKRCGARIGGEDPIPTDDVSYHANPAYQVLFGLGAATLAFSLTEQLGRMPAAVVCPVVHGTLVSGLHAGFEAMTQAGLGPCPQIFGVSVQPSVVERGATPEGYVSDASHAQEVLEATSGTGGDWVGVDELSVDRTLRIIWREGVHITPPAAAPIAWWLNQAPPPIHEKGPVVFILTSHGIRHRVPLAGNNALRSYL